MRATLPKILSAAALTAALAGAACDSPTVRPAEPAPLSPTSETELITALEAAYAALDENALESLLHPGFGLLKDGSGWCRDTHLCIHRRLFASARGTAVEPPVHPDLAVEGITLGIQPQAAFVPVDNYYRTPGFPDGLDPETWRLTAAPCRITAFLNTRGQTDYRVDVTAVLLIAKDLTKAVGADGRFTLFRWDETQVATVQASEVHAFSAILGLYGEGCVTCPNGPVQPPVPSVIRSAEELVQAASAALSTLAGAAYDDLLMDDFRFYVAATVGGARFWDRAEESRVIDRMVHPGAYAGTADPVPRAWWPTALAFVMTRTSNFTERPEYYVSPTNPTGLDRARWRATSGGYRCDGSLYPAGAPELEFHCTATVIVAEDLTVPPDSSRRFFLYRWFDTSIPAGPPGGGGAPSALTSWSDIKALYR